ncbi:uncharacterized protein LOC143146082 [Ptiloglossa arizonensis]|uniref:uncharacterized protein LOC143146082 n=1 Tax=Ptiloglossa arizonensis TaxID=3350558 RepID=UPI003FA1318B
MREHRQNTGGGVRSGLGHTQFSLQHVSVFSLLKSMREHSMREHSTREHSSVQGRGGGQPWTAKRNHDSHCIGRIYRSTKENRWGTRRTRTRSRFLARAFVAALITRACDPTANKAAMRRALMTLIISRAAITRAGSWGISFRRNDTGYNI